MTLTLERCAKIIRHVAGNTPVALEPAFIVDQCGTWLYGAHEWKFRQRPPVYLDLVAGQDFISLPSDLWEIIWPEGATMLWGIRMTDLATVMSARLGNFPIDGVPMLAALVYEPKTLNRRLEIFPTPGTSVVKAAQVAYLSGWFAPQDDSDTIEIPDFLEPVFIAGLMVWARSFFVEDEGMPHERLEGLRRSSMFASAQSTDGGAQPDNGQMQGGSIQMYGGYSGDESPTVIAVPLPSP